MVIFLVILTILFYSSEKSEILRHPDPVSKAERNDIGQKEIMLQKRNIGENKLWARMPGDQVEALNAVNAVRKNYLNENF